MPSTLRLLVVLSGVFSVACAAQSQAFSDAFTRADMSAASTTGSDIGSGYVITTAALPSNGGGTAGWRVVSDGVEILPGSLTNDTLTYQPSWQTQNSNASGLYGFTTSATMRSATGYMGLVLNYQDTSDFYAVRVKPGTNAIQLFYVQNSGTVVTGAAASATLPFTVTGNTNYTMSVHSTAKGVFQYTFTNGDQYATGTLTDSSARFGDGYAGLYATLAQCDFDNFDVTSSTAVATHDWLVDPHFTRGVTVLDPTNPNSSLGPLEWTTANGTPIWKELESKTYVDTLYAAAGSPNPQADGSTQWSIDLNGISPYESLNLGPVSASKNYDFLLRENSNAFYSGVFRTSSSAPWPNEYLQQRISPPGGSQTSTVAVNALQSLPFSITACIPDPVLNHDTSAGYNPSLHAAHFNIFVTIQNLNSSSSGYGDYYFFGMRLYDDTATSVTGLHEMFDAGTGKYNFNVGIKPFSSTNLGEMYQTISGDLLPLIKQGLVNAWKHGALPASFDMSDYHVGGYSVSWEVTGLSNVLAQVKDLSLQGTY